MLSRNISSRWLIVPALLLAFCSRGNAPSPTSPSGTAAGAAGDQGIVGTSAAGDVKNGPIEISLVRVAQSDGVPAFFANAGGVYPVLPRRLVEIYVQIWSSATTLADAPRLIVEWGDGERDNIHCGPCALTRTYRTEGTYIVTVTMDDRVGGTTKRTFTLDVRDAESIQTNAVPSGTVRLVSGGTLPVEYYPCGSGSPGSCTAAAAQATCQSVGRKVVSHASDGTPTVASLGATTSCQWSISYFTVGVQMPAGACLVGVSNLSWSSCCTTANWHGNTVGFGAPNATFGYVDAGNSGYVAGNPNVSGQTWGCDTIATPAANTMGCTQQFIACTP